MVDNNWRRHPKGDADGGKFAPEVGSESTVELSSESVPFESDAAAFEKEFGARATELDPWVKRSPDAQEPAQEQAPAPIKLGGAVEYAEGSWQYPPPPTSDFEKMAAYWSNVLIPDNALQNLENADRNRDPSIYAKEWDDFHYSVPLRTKRWKKNQPEEYAAYLVEDAARESACNRVWLHLGVIPTSDLRDVARLGAFWEQARGFSEDLDAKASAMEFVTSGGKIVKLLDVVQKYRLWEISDAFFNRVRYSRPD